MIKTTLALAVFMAISSLSMGQISGQSVLYNYDSRGNEVKRYTYYTGNKKGNEEDWAGAISVFPNPANEVVTVLGDSGNMVYSFQVFTKDGRLVEDFTLNGLEPALLNVSEYATGVYLIIPIGDGYLSESIARFIVQH